MKDGWWKMIKVGERWPGPLPLPCEPTGLFTHEGDPLFRQVERVVFCIPSSFGDILIEIPDGFVWDGASIPALGPVRRLIGQPLGKYAPAALLHDWWYACRLGGGTDKGDGRLAADKIFRFAMVTGCGISSWRAWAMFQAVRLGGSKAWMDKDTEVAAHLAATGPLDPFGVYGGIIDRACGDWAVRPPRRASQPPPGGTE